jgi:DNA-binding LytR/AlgR family response regulator
MPRGEEEIMSVSTRDGMVVLAVDDEEPALHELAHLLDADENVHTVLTASDSTEALRIMNGRTGHDPATVDAVFLDIRMPGLDGLELARILNDMTAPPSVVFVTAHDDRAVDAYALGAIDYLLKPLHPERLGASVHRVLANRPATPPPAPPEDSLGDEVIPVELAGTVKLVPRSEVRFVEAHGDYARLHTAEGNHLVRIPVSTLEDRWHEAGFLRIHRRFLVSLRMITALQLGGSGHVVCLGRGSDAVELPVSRRHIREVRRRLRGDGR